MRKIEINSIKDFKKIKHLKGNETIYLVIGKIPRRISMEAIDLKDFYGTISISFLNKSSYHVFDIVTCNVSSCKAFFEHASNAYIYYDQNLFFNFCEQRKSIHVSSAKKFLELIHNEEKDQITIFIKEDIVFPKKENIKIPKHIHIIGDDHTFYLSKESTFSKSAKYSLKTIFYDQKIEIAKIEDFEKARNIKDGVVILNLISDIHHFTLNSISLPDFRGKIVLLGNHHTLSQGVIYGEEEVGLFGILNPFASLCVTNLTLDAVRIISQEARYAGAFLGYHGNSYNSYMSFPEPVIFLNCKLKNSFITSGSIDYGNFVGNYDEAMQAEYCEIHNTYVGSSYCDSLFGQENIIIGAFCDTQKYGYYLKK